MRLAAIFFLMSAQSVWACPQALDRENGLILTRTDPFFSVLFRSSDQGLTEQRIMDRGAGPEEVSTVYPHPLVVGERVSSTATLSLSYSAPVSQLDRLDETGTWRSDVVLQSGQEVLGRGTATLSFLGNSTIAIGACQYDVWQVEDRFELEGREPIVFDKFYSPKLGLVLNAIRLSPNRDPISTVEFDTIEEGAAL